MGDHPGNPTLLVGLGVFGREVLALAASEPAGPSINSGRDSAFAGPSIRRASLASIEAPDPAAHQGIVERAKDALRALLDLAHFIDTSDPTDARGPRCDVFVIADLGEPGVALAAPALALALEAELRAEFRAVLGAGEGALAVCPLLSAPRAADRAAVVTAVRALAARAADTTRARGTPARVYLAEDQSGKYLLSRQEVVRSFAGFLHLVLYARLRDAETGARPLIERDRREGPCFATFACATLAFDGDAVLALCAVLLAREVIRRFREGAEPTVAEIGAGAQALLPTRAAIEHDLWKEGSLGSVHDGATGRLTAPYAPSPIEQHLAPPEIDVPEILADDTPEEIVEHKLGPLWRARAAREIAAYCEDIERFKMDRLAAEMEHNGKACIERIEADLAAKIRDLVTSGPRGHARALTFCREARARTRADLDALAAEIEAPNLAPLPPSPLDAGLWAVEQAAFARPRRHRMKVFGVLATGLGAALVAGALRGALRALALPEPPYFDSFAPLPLDFPWILARGPVPYALGGALAASSVGYRLWKHDRRHHNWVVEARDSLDQSLKGYLSRDVVGHFLRRLEYGRLLWVQRILKRALDRLDEAIAALEGVRAALAAADAELERDARRLDERLEGSPHAAPRRADGSRDRGGILLRSLVDPADARALYEEVKPPEVATLARKLLGRTLPEDAAPAAWAQAPFADPRRLVAFCRAELSDLDTLSPFGDESPALRRASGETVRAFLRQLALKLSPPLELVETAALDTSRVDRIAFVHPAAEALLRGTLEEENLRGGWDIRATSGDPRRVHLLVARGGIDLAALALTADAKAKPER